MSWQAARAALDVRTINPTAKLVYLALALRAGKDGRAWPSITQLAKDTGLGRSTIRRALGQLAEQELVTVFHRPGSSSIVTATPPATSGVRSLRALTPPAAGPRSRKEVDQEVAPSRPVAPDGAVKAAMWLELADGTVKRAP
ncbi:MAG TPA: helix-turn-helix domain-containing protein [Acidimicrobiales bacterium]